ncbi:hypothetical protein CLU79DRAFT_709769, partial [Phycomyces nitens]
SKMVKQYQKNADLEVIKWLAYSPDLSQIENIWAYLRRTNLKELKQVLKKWCKIPIEVCAAHCNSIPNRLYALQKNKGLHTKY